MPKYLDYHEKMPELTPEMAEQMTARLKSGQPDQFGVTGLNVFIGTKGNGWCLTEGPSAQAVVDGHKAMGVELGISQVHEVQSVV